MDIFFVISGFIIVLVSRDLHGTPGGVRSSASPVPAGCAAILAIHHADAVHPLVVPGAAMTRCSIGSRWRVLPVLPARAV